MTVNVGKKKTFEAIRPGQVFRSNGKNYIKPRQSIVNYGIAMDLIDFDLIDGFDNFQEVYLLGETKFEV